MDSDSKASKAWDRFTEDIKTSPKSPVASFIDSLLKVIEESKESTMQGLFAELKSNSEYLLQQVKLNDAVVKGRTNLSLISASEILSRYLTKQLTKLSSNDDISEIKKVLITAGKEFAISMTLCKDKIRDLALEFIKNGITILVHGCSKVVEHVLLSAASKGIRFSVICTETRPGCDGYDMYEALNGNIPELKIVVDSAIAYVMEQVDIVLVGAEAVVENGGIINRIGTYTTAICAKSMKIPFYVVSESFKFTRLFPLCQKDLPDYVIGHKPFEIPFMKNKENLTKFKDLKAINPNCDYTPPELITLIFTDLGIFTPSAVSDELIQIFNL